MIAFKYIPKPVHRDILFIQLCDIGGSQYTFPKEDLKLLCDKVSKELTYKVVHIRGKGLNPFYNIDGAPDLVVVHVANSAVLKGGDYNSELLRYHISIFNTDTLIIYHDKNFKFKHINSEAEMIPIHNPDIQCPTLNTFNLERPRQDMLDNDMVNILLKLYKKNKK